jgi:hypothetical protein
MQIALRPFAVRALLLVAGVVLGLVAFLTVFAATTSSHGATVLGDSSHTVNAGPRWL